MELDIEENKGIKTILLQADERLDLSAFGKFCEAAALANEHHNASIVVDFDRTRQLLDSGESMLLFLHYKCGRMRGRRINLVNVNPEIMNKLVQDQFPAMFDIATRANDARIPQSGNIGVTPGASV